MKTAEEYWDQHMKNTACPFRGCSDLRQSEIRELVAAIAADARADALAEAKVDPDDTHEAREWKRFQAIHRELWKSEIGNNTVFHRSFAEYVKTLPPRPMRSPEQQVFEAARSQGWFAECSQFSDCSERTLSECRAVATDLGVQPKE